jgi:hypothetical protein
MDPIDFKIKTGKSSLTDLTGIYKHFAIIIITHFTHNICHKINTMLAQLTTATEVLTAQEQLSTKHNRKRIASVKKQEQQTN